MNKWMVAFAVILLLAVAAVFISQHDREISNSEAQFQESSELDSSQEESQEGFGSENIGDCNVAFTEYLVDPSYVQKIGQIGVVHGSGKYIVERSYISVREEFREEMIPLYAPTDMTLFRGSRYNLNDGKYLDDYALDFDAGCGIQVTLAHVKAVVPAIEEQLPEAKGDSRTQEFNPKIEFKAGELMGHYIQQQGEGAVAGFDFITRNESFENSFINQERYQDRSSQNLLHGVCPYDFYTGEKKEAYYNLFGSAGGTIFKVKDCGNASRDKAGTISGMWFLEKEISGYPFEEEGYKEGDYGSTLPISGDEAQVTIGNLGSQATIPIYSNNPTYKLPTEVTTEHCYQIIPNFNPDNKEGYVYFKVLDAETIEVFFSPSGQCPSAFPEGQGKLYYK